MALGGFCSFKYQVLVVVLCVLSMHAFLGRAFLSLSPTTRRLVTTTKDKIVFKPKSNKKFCSLHYTSVFSRILSLENGGHEKAQESRIRGAPRNRRKIEKHSDPDEEEFAALSAQIPSRDPAFNEDYPSDRNRRAAKAIRSHEPVKKKQLAINPNWKGGGRKGKLATETFSDTRKDIVALDGTFDEIVDDEEYDDEEEDLVDIPHDVVVRALNSRDYEKARKLADMEEEDEEDMDDEDDVDEPFDLPTIPSGKRPGISMAERLKMAQSGRMFNPYVANLHTSTKSSAKQPDGEEDEEEEEDDGSPTAGREQQPLKAPKPVRYQYKIVMDAGTCPGCGNAFQTRNDSSPGYVPSDIYQRLQEQMASQLAGSSKGKKTDREVQRDTTEEGEEEERGGDGDDLYQGLTAEEEVEMLLSGLDREEFEKQRRGGIIPAGEIKEEREDNEEEEEEEDDDEKIKTVICQRCHKLKHYGEVEASLRPGWSDHELLTPERFRDLVSVVRKKRCGVVCLVDIFDFHGSLLYNLPRIVGGNPVLIAVNKADLLPSDFKEDRIKVWVKHELEKIGMNDVSTHDIFLISCKTGHNVKPLLKSMKVLARQRKRDLYVIGSANVGKSTFINRLIELGRSGGNKDMQKRKKKKKTSEVNKEVGTLVTTSPLPGTTLNFIEIDLGDRISLYDTPGLILPHQLTTVLNTEELKAVIPQKRINHVTLRLKEGKSVLLGGLVRLDMLEGRPFLFTFYVSNDVKLHQTSTERADEFLEEHIGELIFPPYNKERLGELGKMVPRDFEIEGAGWKTSAIDIVISGLGWISVTGALSCKVRVMAPEVVGIRLRSPLMPYETWETTAKWTGLRAVKTDKQKGGSR